MPGLPLRGKHSWSKGSVRPGHLICRIPEAVVSDGDARLGARIWLAVRKARPESGGPPWDGSFLLRVTVHQFEPALSIKQSWTA